MLLVILLLIILKLQLPLMTASNLKEDSDQL